MSDDLPESVVEGLISTCYQASLLHEEERPVTFRAILAEPDMFPPEEGPPTGLHRVEFPSPRLFDIQELRRLSPAADFYRSLIGVGLDEDGGLRIWGMIYSGPRWLRTFQGGRDIPQSLPPCLVLHVTGPGRIEAHKGMTVIAKLEGGELRDSSIDVFESEWLPASFAQARSELAELHAQARAAADEPWAPLDTEVARDIGRHVIKRLISIIRDSHHGGVVIFLPPELTEEFSGENPYVDFKYPLAEGSPRRRYRALIVDIMNVLAERYGDEQTSESIGWEEYEASTDKKIAELDEAIFEMSHLMAGLSAVDGATVMTKRFEILGFGAEISGRLPAVKTVARALDIEGERVVKESTEGVGTRHRSAYRLCNTLHDAITVVVSQDGSVRFVRWKDGIVTYWDQA